MKIVDLAKKAGQLASRIADRVKMEIHEPWRTARRGPYSLRKK